MGGIGVGIHLFIFFGDAAFLAATASKKDAWLACPEAGWQERAKDAVVDRVGEMTGTYLVRISLLSLVTRRV